MMIKIQNHSVYKGKTNKQIVIRIRKIQKLLKQFDVQAYAFDPGVIGQYRIDSVHVADLSFGYYEWKWLEPLLRELLMYRRKYERMRKE